MAIAFKGLLHSLPPRKVVKQKLISALYPPLCLACRDEVEDEGFCGSCWAETDFIVGNICDACGAPLFSDDASSTAYCDTCLASPPDWQRGRAAVLYNGGGARVIMALKYADRWDLAKPLAHFMISAARDILPADIVAPVPLHWRRLFTRKYNQAALLSAAVSDKLDTKHIPDLLHRHKHTVVQKDMNRETRLQNQMNAISMNPKFKDAVQNKRILLIDDVMTTGATLSACADACKSAGSRDVNVLVFARVAKPL